MHLMLKNYGGLVSSLTQVETRLLSRQLQHLQTVLYTGFTPLNWNSQRIPSFIETCNKTLNEFSGIVSQIHKSSTMIREVVSRYSCFSSSKSPHSRRHSISFFLCVRPSALCRFLDNDSVYTRWSLRDIFHFLLSNNLTQTVNAGSRVFHGVLLHREEHPFVWRFEFFIFTH